MVNTHPALNLVSPDAWARLLGPRDDVCEKVSTFLSRADTLRKIIAKTPVDVPNGYYYGLPESQSGDRANKFIGDVFEIFAGQVIELTAFDDRLGISNLEWVNNPDSDDETLRQEDAGVDAVGRLAKDGRIIALQFKKRRWDKILDANREHLDNFRSVAYARHKVNPQSNDQLLIVHSGQSVSYKDMTKLFGGHVKYLGLNGSWGCIKGAQKKHIDSLFSLKTICDDNALFWAVFRNTVGLPY